MSEGDIEGVRRGKIGGGMPTLHRNDTRSISASPYIISRSASR